MAKTRKIEVKGSEITILDQDGGDYISLTDMAKSSEGEDQIKNWLKNKNTIEFLGTWELMNNPSFNSVDFDLIKNEAGTNRFLMSVKQWIEKTSAIGITSKAGRYGGTYAHKDIAYHFGMWISPEFQLLIIKEFDRLKEEEAERKEIGWDMQRYLAKVNYKLQTDSIKQMIIPTSKLPEEKKGIEYATEADLINIAVFGQTAKEWQLENQEDYKKGYNLRDVANLYQNNVVSNLEVLNSKMIRQGIDRNERLKQLREEAIFQLRSLQQSGSYSMGQIQSPFSTSTSIGFDAYEDVTKKKEMTDFDKKLVKALNYDEKGKKE